MTGRSTRRKPTQDAPMGAWCPVPLVIPPNLGTLRVTAEGADGAKIHGVLSKPTTCLVQ